MNDKESRFDADTPSDTEVDAMLDDLLKKIGQKRLEMEKQPAIVNPLRLHQVLYTYKIMRDACKSQGAKVSYTVHTPFHEDGCVHVTGKSIRFNNADAFLQAVELADNFDVCPLADGTVQIDFTFYGLTEFLENPKEEA